MRLLFTGGSGKAGKHIIPELIALGHKVLNVDLVPLDIAGVDNLKADITDLGQMFNALSSYGSLAELDDGSDFRHGCSGRVAPRFDAVIHFAAIPRILLRPDSEAYFINTMGTYNVLEAALKLGIRKIIFASSETTYGICFSDSTERMPEYLPIDEEHPTIPEDSYATSKVVNEVTARSFQRRSGADIYGIRINNVVEPHEYQQDFPRYFADPGLRRRNIFAYIDARDLGQLVHRCLLTDGLGYQVFNASNDEHSVHLSTPAILEQYYKGVPVRGEIGEHETLYSNAKAKRVLGWQPQHSWSRYVSAPSARDEIASAEAMEIAMKRQATEDKKGAASAGGAASKRTRR